jgi:hypothetical protein
MRRSLNPGAKAKLGRLPPRQQGDAERSAGGGRRHHRDLEQLDQTDQPAFVHPVGELAGCRRAQKNGRIRARRQAGSSSGPTALPPRRQGRRSSGPTRAQRVVVERRQKLRRDQRAKAPRRELATVPPGLFRADRTAVMAPFSHVRGSCASVHRPAYLVGTLEKAAAMANHASTRTARLYDHRRDELSVDEGRADCDPMTHHPKRSKSVAETRHRAERRWPKTRRAKMN